MTDPEFDSTVLVGGNKPDGRTLSVIVVMDGKAITHQLPPNGEVKIGRFTGSKLIINHETLSRFHAILRIVAQAITIEDLGSANGTFVREARITPGRQVPVNVGDVVRVGEVFLILRRMP